MKKLAVHVSLAAILLTVFSLESCKSKPKDSDLQTAFAEKARGNAQLANIKASVTGGVLTLDGQCPDEACKTSAEQVARDVKGVTSVTNHIYVTPPPPPVAINDDAAIRSSISTVVQKYPGVTADVQNGAVTLRGNIKRDNLQKLMMAVNEANIKNVNNQLTIK